MTRTRWVPRPGRTLALVAALLDVVMLALTIVVKVLAHQLSLSGLGMVPLYLVFGVIGLVVTWHQPRNILGWVLQGTGFFFLATLLAQSYAVLGYRAGHGTWPLGGLVVCLAGLTTGLGLTLVGISLLLFPQGSVPSARWRPVVAAYLAMAAAYTASAVGISIAVAAHGQIQVDPDGTLAVLTRTSGPYSWFSRLAPVFFLAIGACWLAWLAGQAVSYRRAAGEHRLQLKWLLSGAVVFVCTTIIQVSLDGSTGWWRVAGDLATVGTFALPVSIGIGILKFRLYDIDRIISRTLAYVLVTGLLIGVYTGLVLLATRELRVSSPISVAGATLVAAALFNPLRRRLQRAVDRRFNRARYDADRTVAAFAARLQDHVELDAVRADLLEVVSEALEPTHLSLWTSPWKGSLSRPE